MFFLFLCCCEFQVNVSELGLVTPAGKVVWGKIILLDFLFIYNLLFLWISTPISACLIWFVVIYDKRKPHLFCDGCREIRSGDK